MNSLIDLLSERNSIFVTGTDTDIGKTFFCAELASQMKKRNMDVAYFKPVMSGTPDTDGKAVLNDCQYVSSTAGLFQDPSEQCVYSYKHAYSPHLACEIEKGHMDSGVIKKKFDEISKRHQFTIVEGCGGIVCPLFRDGDSILWQEDLINLLNLDVIVVCSSDLGAITTAVTTAEYIKKHGMGIAAIMMNRFDSGNIKHRDNRKIIEDICRVKVFTLENQV